VKKIPSKFQKLWKYKIKDHLFTQFNLPIKKRIKNKRFNIRDHFYT